jgi:pimeloyl-ACP methyl ester carboxylesterase
VLIGKRGETTRLKRPRQIALILVFFLALSGCATPVGVLHLTPEQGYKNLTSNVFSGGSLSTETTQILNRSGLADEFKDKPEKVIAILHKGLPTANERDRVFALAELSFLHASEGKDRSYFLAAAVYAYDFLFPKEKTSAFDPFDPRVRLAAELYNQGISKGFLDEKTGDIVLKEGAYQLPFGELRITFDQSQFTWGSFRLVRFTDASMLKVRGLRNQYRWAGLGAPLVASLEHIPDASNKAFKRVTQVIKVAATALLLRDNETENGITARLELRTTAEGTSADIEGQTIPLEFWLSAALADSLEGSKMYKFELKALLYGNILPFTETGKYMNSLFLMEPYRPGRIPLVLVHGTASSPARWAQLINEIQNDRELWGRYQIWLFTYSTGNPIAYSAGIFTEALKETVAELDPEGKDQALKKMVIMGHSQGGLLAKLAVVDSGSIFLDKAIKVPLEDLDMDDETKAVLVRSTVFKTLPFVKRVVFIATPHRGSYLGGGFVATLLSKLISLPTTILKGFQETLIRNPENSAKISLKSIPKSIDDMNPSSTFITLLSSLPVSDGVAVHSIIPVKNRKAPQKKWTDGVVKYSSAHIDGAVSELIVNSGHSTQDEPETIEEVRRILIENLREAGDK